MENVIVQNPRITLGMKRKGAKFEVDFISISKDLEPGQEVIQQFADLKGQLDSYIVEVMPAQEVNTAEDNTPIQVPKNAGNLLPGAPCPQCHNGILKLDKFGNVHCDQLRLTKNHSTGKWDRSGCLYKVRSDGK